MKKAGGSSVSPKLKASPVHMTPAVKEPVEKAKVSVTPADEVSLRLQK